ACREPEYYADLSARMREIVLLVSILVAVMAIGAGVVGADTMYAAGGGRRRGVAMVRTGGFRRCAIVAGFLIESFLICTAACATGLIANLLYHRSRQDFLSDITWTTIAFESKLTPGIVLGALGVALVVGMAGGSAPAIKAARTSIIEALRK